MKTIKFSHDYMKLPLPWEDTEATLLLADTYRIEELQKQCQSLIEYDTKYRNEEGYYPLLFKDAILLLFLHHESPLLGTGKLFTTIRRFTKGKYAYYYGAIGETFVLKRIREEKK